MKSLTNFLGAVVIVGVVGVTLAACADTADDCDHGAVVVRVWTPGFACAVVTE